MADADVNVRIRATADTAKAKRDVEGVGASMKASMLSATAGVRSLTGAMKLLSAAFGPLMAIIGIIALLQKLWQWGNKAFEWIQKAAGIETTAEKLDRLGREADKAADLYKKLTEEIDRNTKAMIGNAKHAQSIADEKRAQAIAAIDTDTANRLAATTDPEVRRRIQQEATAAKTAVDDSHGRDALQRDRATLDAEIAAYKEKQNGRTLRAADLRNEREGLKMRLPWASGGDRDKLNEQLEANRKRIDEFNKEARAMNEAWASISQRSELLRERMATQAGQHGAKVAQNAQAVTDADNAEKKRKDDEAARAADSDRKRAEAIEKRRQSIMESAAKRIEGITVSAPAAATSITAIGGMMGASTPRIEDLQRQRHEEMKGIAEEMRRSLAKIEEGMEGD